MKIKSLLKFEGYLKIPFSEMVPIMPTSSTPSRQELLSVKHCLYTLADQDVGCKFLCAMQRVSELE